MSTDLLTPNVPFPPQTGAAALTKVRLFGVEMARVTLTEAADYVFNWTREPGFDSKYVVTPNVDHVVQLEHSEPLRQAYQTASLVTADGAPVVLASRLLGRPLPERVTGSDLVPAVFDRAEETQPLRVYLLGAGPGVAERAAANIEQRWPHVRVVGTDCPPLGFEKSEEECRCILDLIDAAEPDVLVVGLGAPKQELWVSIHQNRIRAKAVLCAGATIDFLAGEKQRAPKWAQRTGLEWLHRLLSEPRRLFKRYLNDALVFPRLVLKEWLQGR